MSDSKAISGKFRVSIAHLISVTGVQGNTEYKVYGENTLRVDTTFTTSGSLKVQARIEGSSSWTQVGELTSSISTLSMDISTYDYIRFNFTTAAGSSGVIAASGFFKAASSGGGGSMTDVEVKAAYENNADTNEFSDAEQTKLSDLKIVSVAVVKDEQVSGTISGTFTSGAWRTRDLNTESDPDGILTVSSNRFTLTSAGTYLIYGSAPAHRTARHKCKLVQDPAGTPSDLVIGTSEYASAGDLGTTRTQFSTTVVTSGSETFELQHYCQTSSNTNGFGYYFNVVGVTEVYSEIFVIKLG